MVIDMYESLAFCGFQTSFCFFDYLIIMCLTVDNFEFILVGVDWCLEFVNSYISSNLGSFQSLKNSTFLAPFSPRTLILHVLFPLMVHSSLMLCSFFFTIFYCLFSDLIIFDCPIFVISSASSNLFLDSSREYSIDSAFQLQTCYLVFKNNFYLLIFSFCLYVGFHVFFNSFSMFSPSFVSIFKALL